ncbi:MAG: CopL family metal-binding regulatory protein [Lysobacter sp.]|nr:CopL family metal-binding regulatory protein [Lysobacter sp.]
MLSILLRGLLSLSLILNGSGYAMASMHTQMGHMDSVSSTLPATPQPVAATEPPCYQHHGASAVVVVELPDAMQDEPSTKRGHPSPDCCKSGACHCACIHQAQAAIPTHVLRHDTAEHASSVRPLKPGHPAPALPHLIRPPIS